MSLYRKINQFVVDNSYLPDTMYGDSSKCVIKYEEETINDGIGQVSECKNLYKNLKKRIEDSPEFWNYAEIKVTTEPSSRDNVPWVKVLTILRMG